MASAGEAGVHEGHSGAGLSCPRKTGKVLILRVFHFFLCICVHQCQCPAWWTKLSWSLSPMRLSSCCACGVDWLSIQGFLSSCSEDWLENPRFSLCFFSQLPGDGRNSLAVGSRWPMPVYVVSSEGCQV